MVKGAGTQTEFAHQKTFHILKFATVTYVECLGNRIALLTLIGVTLVLIWLRVFQVVHSS